MTDSGRQEEMTFAFRCACGRSLKGRASLVGKNAICPGCGKKLVVPPPKTKTANVRKFHRLLWIPPLGLVLLGLLVFLIFKIFDPSTVEIGVPEKNEAVPEYEAPLPKYPESAESNAASKPENAVIGPQIKATYEITNSTRDNGESLINMLFKNPTDKKYRGGFTIILEDSDGNEIERQYLDLEFPLDPGTQIKSLMWTKTWISRIKSISIIERGTYEKISFDKPKNIDYEEMCIVMGWVGNANVYLYLPSKDQQQMQGLAEYYEKKYPSGPTLFVFFHDERIETKDPEGGNPYASYIHNRVNGHKEFFWIKK